MLQPPAFQKKKELCTSVKSSMKLEKAKSMSTEIMAEDYFGA